MVPASRFHAGSWGILETGTREPLWNYGGIQVWDDEVEPNCLWKHIPKEKMVCLTTTTSKSLETLESKLIREYDAILLQKELYWKQKARMNWSVHGELNTRSFHASVLHRRRKAKIQQLRDKARRWCTEDREIQQMALEFYEKLYKEDANVSWDESSWLFPKLKQNCIWWLNREVTDYDVKSVISKFGAHKAPGSDGIPASFIQKYWAWVGQPITVFVLNVFRTGQVPKCMNR